MHLIVLADDVLKDELTCSGVNENTSIEWIQDFQEFKQFKDADGLIDLLFKPEEKRIELLKEFNSKPVIINSVDKLSKGALSNFVRINGWPTMLKRTMIEASVLIETLKPITESIFSSLNRRVQWLPDEPGYISARVIAMIINEAFFALAENVSTPQEIDTAMKLGTNYPFGPFEWSEKIGIQKIYSLLKELSRTNTYYEPSALLKKAATGI